MCQCSPYVQSRYCGGLRCQQPAAIPAPAIVAAGPSDADLYAHGWAPGNYCGPCRQCGGRYDGAKRCACCRSCAVAEFHERAASRPADLIATYEALAKAVLADIPAALRADGCDGLEDALAAAVTALRAYRRLGTEGLPS
jgi:hypothetical protein